MSTETEEFWAGEFGDQYLERNRVEWRKRVPFFSRIIKLTDIKSVLEVGCNAGQNLLAIQKAGNIIDLAGCDVNLTAALDAELALPSADIVIAAANDIPSTFEGQTFDMVMTAGVLIHIPSHEILNVMRSIVEMSNRWVLAIEYDSPTAEEINYRGHAGRLWKRPYGLIYESLGLRWAYMTHLGEHDGFGPGCTAWLMKKESA